MTGADLKACRTRLALTQVMFAQKIGVSDRTIRGAEHSPEAPLTRNLEARLAKFVEADVQSSQQILQALPTSASASTESSISPTHSNPESASEPAEDPEPTQLPFVFF